MSHMVPLSQSETDKPRMIIKVILLNDIIILNCVGLSIWIVQ